jgi:hypothetical protein
MSNPLEDPHPQSTQTVEEWSCLKVVLVDLVD